VGDALLSAQRAHARRNLAHVSAFIDQARHRLSWVPPAEGAIGFVRYAGSLPSTEFAQRLADRSHTVVVPGACFGYEQHFRVGFGGDTETLLEGLRRLWNFVSALQI
jgi:aspartate/methionine/tyrosine aminotransferase